MPEGESTMPTPEQKSPEAEKPSEFSFEEKIKILIEPPKEGEKAEITNEYLLRIARTLLRPRNRTKERLERYLTRADELYIDGKIPEEEWVKMAPVLEEESSSFLEIEDKRKIGVVPKEGVSPETERILLQAAEAIGRAAEVQDRFARGEYALDLPQSKDEDKDKEKERRKIEQRLYVRAILDGIENSNRDCHDWSISTVVKNLEASLGRMESEIAAEVRARLAVHDASELIKQAGGWIERDSSRVGPGYAIGSAATEATRRGHELNRSVIEAFLKKGLFGLEIAQAWDLLQDACFRYIEFLDKTEEWFENRNRKPPFNRKNLKEYSDDERNQGLVDSNFFVDSDSVRKDAVREFLIEQLMKKKGLDRISARKSFQLAEKLAIASLETSTFNRTAQAGNDELAEMIGFKGWRTGRARTGRVRGPKVTEMKIDGFGESWMRANAGKKEIVEKGKKKKIKIGVDKPLYAKDVDLNEIREGDYVYFCTVTVTRYHLLKKLLLDRRPKPWPDRDCIDKTTLQTAVVYFNTADGAILTDDEKKALDQKKDELCRSGKSTEDAEGEVEKLKSALLAPRKCGPKKLRVWWLLGLVDVALSDINLEWNGSALGELARMASREELSPKAETFVTQEQWDWIEKSLKVNKRLRSLGGRRGLRDYTQRILKGK